MLVILHENLTDKSKSAIIYCNKENTNLDHKIGQKKWQKNSVTLHKLARHPLKICANFVEHLKKILFSKDFLSRHRKSPRDFSRTRLLPFPSVILVLITTTATHLIPIIWPF